MSKGRKGVKLARYDLVPEYPLSQLALVYGMGGQKYGDQNWRNGLTESSLIGAARRHIGLWVMGEDADDESGLVHLAHAAWMLFGAMELALRGDLERDLPKYTKEQIEEIKKLWVVTNPEDIFNEDEPTKVEKLLADPPPYIGESVSAEAIEYRVTQALSKEPLPEDGGVDWDSGL